MELKTLIILCIALYGKYADCATISAWTQPVIAAGDAGSGIVTTTVAEGTAVGATTITIAATGAAATGAFSIFSQTPSGVFTIHTDTGILSIASSPNREAGQYVVMVIKALDTEATPGTSSATVSVSITDVNDVTPVCSTATTHSNVRDGSCSATYISTVLLTDTDSTSTNNEVTHSIASGNTDSRFSIDSSTGQVSVTVGKTIWYEDADTYTLVIQGVDNGTPALTGSCTLKVYVCSAPTISVSIITLFVALLASLR